jgi:hypothetical protein
MPTPSDAPYELHEALPELHEPVLVGMMTGWIDASSAAATAMGVIDSACDMRPLATFDSDVFIDYRARRPTMELREGVNLRLDWPTIVLKVGRDAGGHDVLTLSGPEPDSAWRLFADAVTDLTISLGVRMAVFMGSYPFASPHTRPPRLSASSPTADVIEPFPFLKNSVDVPAGIAAVLEHRFTDKAVPSLGVWAQVPHYLGTMSYPAATAALLEGLTTVTGLIVDAEDVRAEAAQQRQRVDQLVAANDEHLAMVRQLEAIYDASASSAIGTGMGQQEIPSGDELAAEIERFLRTRRDDT